MSKHTNIIVIFLLILIPVLLISSASSKSAAADEFGIMYQGLRIVRHPELVKEFHRGPVTDYIAGLQFYVRDIDIPKNHFNSVKENGYVSAPLIFMQEGVNLRSILLWSRFPFVFVSIIFAIYIYKWAKKLYGEKSALLALVLYVFSPNIIAHSRIVSSDFMFAFLSFLSFYYLWMFCSNVKWKYLVITGIFLGLAMMAKFTAIVLIPIYALLLLFALVRKKEFAKLRVAYAAKFPSWVKHFNKLLIFSLVLMAAVWFVICLAYGFEGVFTPISKSIESDDSIQYTQNPEDWSADKLFGNNKLLRNFADLPSPLPYDFVKSFGYQFLKKSISAKPTGTYLIEGKPTSVWYYYILSFAVKTPLALIILLCLSLVIKQKKKDWFNEVFLLLPIAFFYFFFSFVSKTQFGYRYVLMTIPLLIVFVSKLAEFRPKRFKRQFSILLTLLCIWYVISSVLIYPHYLSYFNGIVGPENGYKYFIDSNIDWGQDLNYLKDYLVKNDISQIKLAYFGYPTAFNQDFPDYYGIVHEDLTCGYQEGTIIISVTNLMRNQDCNGWLLDYIPEARIGYSIMVYNIPS